MKNIFIFLIAIFSILASGCATVAQTYNDDVYYTPKSDTVYIVQEEAYKDVDIYINILNPTPNYIYRPYYYDITHNWNYVYYPFYYSYYWYRPYVWYNYNTYYWDYYRWNRPYWSYNHHNYWHHRHNHHYGHYKYKNNNYNDNNKYIGHRYSLSGNNRNANSRTSLSDNETIKQRKPQSYTPNENNSRRSSNEFISPKYKHRNIDVITRDRNTVKPNNRTVEPSKPIKTNPNTYRSEYNRQEPKREQPRNSYTEPRREQPRNNYTTPRSTSQPRNNYTEPRREQPRNTYNPPRSNTPSGNYRSSSTTPNRSASTPNRSSNSPSRPNIQRK